MSKLTRVLVLSFISSLILLGSSIVDAQNIRIRIERPNQGAEVGHIELVRGNVSDLNAPIYVLVHPMLTKLWWIQRLPSPPNQDGSWQTICYFGTETKGINEYFEVVAIVTLRKLKEGQTISDLPSDAIRSDIIMVKRTL